MLLSQDKHDDFHDRDLIFLYEMIFSCAWLHVRRKVKPDYSLYMGCCSLTGASRLHVQVGGVG